MNGLHRGFAPASYAGTPAARDAHVADQPRRASSLMRRYEVAALRPDLTVDFSQITAPATPVFEACASAFARGTLIDTARGPVAVEDLIPGDYVQTAAGAEPIVWIGSTNYVPGRETDDTSLTSLTRVTSGAMAPGQPPMDLLLGPAARRVVRHTKLKNLLGQEAVLAPVGDYVDGDRFLQITPVGSVQMYHLMVRRHTTITVGGVELETYHPGNEISKTLGQNARALFLSMFPNLSSLGDFGETCVTRTTRDVIENLLNT